jgi:hypothetical protein
MSTRSQLPSIHRHLGEREFLDYPVFLEVGARERSLVLRRSLLAALVVVVVVVVAAVVLR